jgi:hypothetical protein
VSGVCAFTDEYGDASLDVDNPGVTTFFIITAVLVREEVVNAERARAEAIRSKFFGTGEMKSSSVGKDDARRKRILEEIGRLDIATYSLAVDKRELDREGGLAHRKSFFKYLNRRLCTRIFKNVDDTTLVADEYGRDEFMRDFIDYVNDHLPLTLFTRRDISFAKSSDEVMLQVADMVSGSLARALDPRKRSAAADELVALIQKRSLGVEVWPPRGLPELEPPVEDAESDKDAMVRRHCLRSAHQFLREKAAVANPPEDLRAQFEVLQILMFQVQFADAKEYVPTERIMEKVRVQAGVDLSERQVRIIVSVLRDAGVVIGRSAKGYKIPIDERDIVEFVAHANTIVPPMLARVRRAKRDLGLASLGKLDILSLPKFRLLRRLIETMEAEEAAAATHEGP